ncbi:GIN domain-containing protein [Flavobacterium sp. JP2137]|uniref:GIN domain-containing protein n=1 Tax=Flavobacterium sp. JP2137 TaxID=3414510 RepID=UPI003D301481
MIRLIMIFLMFLMSWILQAQSSETRKTASFDGIIASTGVQVILQPNENGDIRVETDGSVDLKNIYTEVSNNTLRVYISVPGRRSISLKSWPQGINVYVSQKGVSRFMAESAAKIKVSKRLKTDKVSITLDSAGKMEGDFSVSTMVFTMDSASGFSGDVSAKKVQASLDSAAFINITGDAEELLLNIDSAASFNGKNFRLKRAKVEADSLGKAEVNVSDSLDAYADSMGKVIYYGNPKNVKKYTDSMGSVKAR